MNPLLIVGAGLGLVGLAVAVCMAYMAGKDDGKAEMQRRLFGGDLTPTRTQCATCLLDVAKCKCLWRRLRGDT